MNFQNIKVREGSLLFCTGAVIYPLLEFIWRGYSHYSMGIAGGICLVLINRICLDIFCDKSVFFKCITGSLIITSVELVIGLVVNKVFLLNVWDYSELPFNILGQVCLPFSVAWFFLCIPAMYICKKICKYAE